MRPIEILLVEDNPGDVRLVREGLGQGEAKPQVHVVGDGVLALAFLRREGAHAQAPRPDLVLLDWNLPRKNGAEVLAAIKSDPDLMGIPVVVLTTSDEETDVRRAYAYHANCYVTKPVELDQFLKVIRAIEDFWCTVARLPR